MNKKLEKFCRDSLKAKLPEVWQNTFKLMYGRNSGKRSVEDSQKMLIDVVVDEIPTQKPSWAMEQVENSLKKLEKPEIEA